MDNEELILEILNDFKLLNNIQKKEQNDEENNETESTLNEDEIYKLYIRKSIQSILNLTNRIKFPIELKFIVLDMLQDSYTINSLKDNIENQIGDYIKSISEEGRKVDFGNVGQSILNSLLSADINERLKTRHKEIYRYRLLYKVGELDNGEN